MPSTATITSFFNFTANTKARASQVNTNFDVFRGHIIPVSPTTATGTTLTYDLGSVDYRWRDVYARSLDFLSNTSTSQQIVLQGSTSGGNTFLSMNINGSETARVGGGGLQNLRNSSLLGYTTSADIGGFASRIINYNSAHTTTATGISGSTVTLNCIGRPVEIKLVAVGNTTGASYFSTALNLLTNTVYFTEIQIIRDNSVSCGTYIHNNIIGTTATVATQSIIPTGFSFFDFPPTGSHSYHVTYRNNANGAVVTFDIVSRIIAYEIN